MALTFRFDADGMIQAIKERLIEVANQMIQEFHRSATNGMANKADTEIESAQASNSSIYTGNTQVGEELIVAKCYFYADAIMESFGIGMGADAGSQSYWNEYVGDETLWNPLRKSKPVVGRPAGPYTDIYGNPNESKGNMEGKIIPWIYQRAGRTIQTAEAWLIKDGETKIERAVETALTKFFMEEASNFFIQEDR